MLAEASEVCELELDLILAPRKRIVFIDGRAFRETFMVPDPETYDIVSHDGKEYYMDRRVNLALPKRETDRLLEGRSILEPLRGPRDLGYGE